MIAFALFIWLQFPFLGPSYAAGGSNSQASLLLLVAACPDKAGVAGRPELQPAYPRTFRNLEPDLSELILSYSGSGSVNAIARQLIFEERPSSARKVLD